MPSLVPASFPYYDYANPGPLDVLIGFEECGIFLVSDGRQILQLPLCPRPVPPSVWLQEALFAQKSFFLRALRRPPEGPDGLIVVVVVE